MNNFLFKNRNRQTPLPSELQSRLIPKNIQTMSELDEYEEQNIAEALMWLQQITIIHLDYTFWTTLHKKLFNHVWKWAGKIRQHDLNNPDFLDPTKIRTELMQLLGDLDFWIENSSYPKKEIIARLHERLLTIHPFSNGNGRWSRILTELYCKKLKLVHPSWNHMLKDNPKKRRDEYILAIEQARQKKSFNDLIKVIFN